MITWLMHALLVSLFATAAAYCIDHALRSVGRQTRHAWTAALVLTLVLPFIPKATSSVPPRAAAVVVDVFSHATVNVNQSAGRIAFDPIALWVVASLFILFSVLVSYARLIHERRHWQSAHVRGQPVFVSKRYGPAVVPFFRPPIVVPQWALNASPKQQELIVAHELEHVAARDPLLVIISLMAIAFMPWNPIVWFQAARLRFAIEADCDQRVLLRAPDRSAYASLLVDVGGKHSGFRVAAALAERRNGLERRVAMVMARVVQNRLRSTALAICGALLVFGACESRAVTDAAEKTTVSEPASVLSVTPAINAASERARRLIDTEYPQALRDAGIGGTVSLKVHVADGGVVDQVVVLRSSGNDELDEAGIRLAKKGQWGNDGPNKHTDYWTTTSFTFQPPQAERWSPPANTKLTVTPELTNREAILIEPKRNYPRLLRDAGVGGTAIVWTLIDKQGLVRAVRIHTTSGHDALDVAAMRVAGSMTFKPALNGSTPVETWIALPIAFKTQ